MKARLSAFAVTLAVLVSQQVVCAQPPGFAMPAGYFAPSPAGNPALRGGPQDASGPCSCDPSCCDPGLEDPACCDPWQVYGSFLYLRPRNVEVTYGVPTEATTLIGVTVPQQLGPMGVVDGRYDPGFRVGLGRALG
jgi:hypothetical protein